MTFGETLEWQRANHEHIKRLAKLGDRLALRLVEAYRALFKDRLNPDLQAQWMGICDDYVRRELLKTERTELQNRFGHKVPGEFHIGVKH